MNAKQKRLARKEKATKEFEEKAAELLKQSKEAENAQAKSVKKKKIDKKPDEEKLKEQNAAETVKAITDKKDLKYRYPKTADNLAERKKFRAEVRRKIKSFEKEIQKLIHSELPEDVVLLEKREKEYQSYAKKVLVAH